MAHVSWQCEQSNPDIQVSGYKVLIDGKQYGNAMHEGVKTVRIKVNDSWALFILTAPCNITIIKTTFWTL